MLPIGIKGLKTHLSKYLKKVAAGETVIVTDRGKMVAQLGPVPKNLQMMDELRRKGVIQWNGKWPEIPRRKPWRPGMPNPDVAGAVIENRRAD